MALCPFAKHELIPPGSNDPAIKARVAIWHVAVSMVESLFRYFNGPSGGIESHFYINWRGKLYQYRDTAFEADANYLANPFAVSIETAGWAAGKWNVAQRRTMKRLALWLRDAEGIPLRKASEWDGEGHGYHIQFGSPGKWTNVAKSCPGPERIHQFHNWFVPWLEKQGTAPAPAPAPQEDDDPMANLDEPLNQHDPLGLIETRGITVREALMIAVVHAVSGRRAAKRVWKNAQKSAAQR